MENERPDTTPRYLSQVPEAVKLSHVAVAASHGSDSVFDLLLDVPHLREGFVARNADENGRNSLVHTSRAGSLRMVERLLALEGVNVRVRARTEGPWKRPWTLGMAKYRLSLSSMTLVRSECTKSSAWRLLRELLRMACLSKW